MQVPSGKAQALQITSPNSDCGAKKMEGKRRLGGILWKHHVTGKVFSVGTRACGFLTKVSLQGLQDH
jgi:hypothetical protein